MRDAVLELWEVQRYGLDAFGDPDYVSVYGMPPADWYAAGIRMLGRTAVECTRDTLGDAIAADIAAIASARSSKLQPLVIDPFAGSANTLFWITRRLPPGTGASGFELDSKVFNLTRRNLLALSSSIDLVHGDYAMRIADIDAATGRLLIVFVAPPWGDALDPTSGLDLRRTKPPVAEIVDSMIDRFPQHHLLLAIQVYERTDVTSLGELERRFDWTASQSYELDRTGLNQGLLLGTRGWAPRS